MPRRKTFSGGEAEIQEFLETATEQVRAHVIGIQATQKQFAWAIRIGMPLVLGMTDQAFGERFRDMAGGTIRLSVEERREAAAQLTAPLDEGGEGLSQREAAAVIGVNQSTLARDLRTPDANASSAVLDGDADASSSQACGECGTPTLPLMAEGSPLLCGRCADNGTEQTLPTGPTVLETVPTN